MSFSKGKADRVSLDVEQLLQSLKEHGTIESEDRAFTLSLSRARRYLASNQSSSPHRFLVALAAGAFRAGATEVRIKPERQGYVISATGAVIDEEGLTLAFGGQPREDRYPGSTDLALSLRLALQCGCQTASLRAFLKGSPGFSWRLSENREVSNEAPPHHSDHLEIELVFPPLSLWQRVFPSPMYRPEVGLLKELCALSDRSITFKGKPVGARPPVPKGRFGAGVGGYRFLGSLDLPQDNWKGCLGLLPGSVNLVVQGVLSGQVEHFGLNGTIWHDGLNLDLSREGVLQDRVWDTLLTEVQSVRYQLLKEAVLSGTRLNDEEKEEILTPLVACWLEEHDLRLREVLREWLMGTRKASEDNELLLAYWHRNKPNWKPSTAIPLLAACKGLESGHRETRRFMETALHCVGSLPSERRDELVQAYLYLGLGAYDSIYADESNADHAWSLARKTISSNALGQELISVHLRYPPRHLLGEVIKALRKCVVF